MPGQISEEYYLRSLFPLLSITTITSLIWFIKNSLNNYQSQIKVALFIVIGLLLLITNNRYVWHSFYINGHLLCAAFAMAISACYWLIAQDNGTNKKQLMPVLLICIPALIFTRPESVMIVTLAAIPLIANESDFSWKQKNLVLLSLSVSTLAYYGFLIFTYPDMSTHAYVYVLYSILIICFVMLEKLLLRIEMFKLLLRNLPRITEALIWLSLLAFFLYNQERFMRSIDAMYKNAVLGSTSWGLSFVILIVIVILILILIKLPKKMSLLRFPVTTFLPLMFIFPFVGRGPYRVGHGDSLDRMLIQIVPLTIIFIVVSIGLGEPRFRKRQK